MSLPKTDTMEVVEGPKIGGSIHRLSLFASIIFCYSCKNLGWKGSAAATPVIEKKFAPYSTPVRWEIWESTDEVKIQTVPGPEHSECGGLQGYVLAVQQSLALLSSLPVSSVRSTDRTEFLNRTNCAVTARSRYGARRWQLGDLDQPWGTGGNIGGSGLYFTPAGSPADRPLGWVAGWARDGRVSHFRLFVKRSFPSSVCLPVC